MRVVEDEQQLVHYEGYFISYDEWRARDEVVDLQPDDELAVRMMTQWRTDAGPGIAPVLLFNLYHELVAELKLPLRKKSPQVRLRMPSDKLILKARGMEAGGEIHHQTVPRSTRYLWRGVVPYRGLNEHEDLFHHTQICFYLYQR